MQQCSNAEIGRYAPHYIYDKAHRKTLDSNCTEFARDSQDTKKADCIVDGDRTEGSR
jgi:hypothetical protein